MVAEGYKNTEFGVIPEDWEIMTYDDVFIFLKTATYSRAELTENDNIGYVHYGDIHTKCQSYYLDLDTIKLPTISFDQLKNYAYIQNGDIIVADASEDYLGVGKSVEIKNIRNRKVISGLHTFLLRSKNDNIVNGFKGLIFYNKLVKQQIDVYATGLKVYSISKNILKTIQIPFPSSKAEQTAIATALCDADTLITATEKLIAKKKAIKQGAMQELLKPKEGWVEKTIDDVGIINYGTRIVQNKQNGGRYYVYGGGGKTFTTHKFNRENCLIISRFAISIECVRFIKEKFFLNDSGLTVKSKNNIDQNFLDYVIISKANEIYNLGAGGAQHNLNIQDFIQIKLFVPKNISEQTRIATILSDMDSEISLLEQKLEKQKQIKQGMMQNLLTGKIRFLGNIEKRAEKPKHNEQINEAVIISFLVNKFGSEGFPLSRFRYTKYSYLLHRQSEKEARGFGKHAAGPYNPANRYKGAENIALKNKYISKVQNPKSKKDAFVVNENIEGALNYFTEWYGTEIQQWIEQFKFYKNEYLEVLTTVDKAICDLKKENKSVSLQTVKGLIEADKVWKKKLDKPYFSDTEIQKAIDESNRLFGYG
ncbi:Hypothetical protein PEIBARAKI_6373 [Petrimonas sp. IBARAKI]|nr:Hypothetical protein PEIBARAKI_6373 [Petrimonas sp. IBARAKI]